MNNSCCVPLTTGQVAEGSHVETIWLMPYHLFQVIGQVTLAAIIGTNKMVPYNSAKSLQNSLKIGASGRKLSVPCHWGLVTPYGNRDLGQHWLR